MWLTLLTSAALLLALLLYLFGTKQIAKRYINFVRCRVSGKPSAAEGMVSGELKPRVASSIFQNDNLN